MARLLAQGTYRPVGPLEPPALGDLHAEVLLEHGREAQAGGAEERGRHARVEQAPDPEAPVAVQAAEVVVRGVQDLFDRRIGQETAQAAHVGSGYGVYQEDRAFRRKLDEADSLRVPVQPVRLDVEADHPRPGCPPHDLGETLRRGDGLSRVGGCLCCNHRVAGSRKEKGAPPQRGPSCGGVPGNTYPAHLLLLLSNGHPPF